MSCRSGNHSEVNFGQSKAQAWRLFALSGETLAPYPQCALRLPELQWYDFSSFPAFPLRVSTAPASRSQFDQTGPGHPGLGSASIRTRFSTCTLGGSAHRTIHPGGTLVVSKPTSDQQPLPLSQGGNPLPPRGRLPPLQTPLQTGCGLFSAVLADNLLALGHLIAQADWPSMSPPVDDTRRSNHGKESAFALKYIQ